MPEGIRTASFTMQLAFDKKKRLAGSSARRFLVLYLVLDAATLTVARTRRRDPYFLVKTCFSPSLRISSAGPIIMYVAPYLRSGLPGCFNVRLNPSNS